ncbi:hypothetical protein G7Y89_g2090 [Cudoniella acicularis]|uniref:AA1-like domain-containing protein n=1 Tax=Cudoniella acicularis TaxID=354080 RepID=A0A8H4RUU1_9HELO|nr:hypothetical protein G7Y89_g2090 [Cudoniella acicularis]
MHFSTIFITASAFLLATVFSAPAPAPALTKNLARTTDYSVDVNIDITIQISDTNDNESFDINITILQDNYLYSACSDFSGYHYYGQSWNSACTEGTTLSWNLNKGEDLTATYTTPDFTSTQWSWTRTTNTWTDKKNNVWYTYKYNSGAGIPTTAE